jgi:hypothetical protein
MLTIYFPHQIKKCKVGKRKFLKTLKLNLNFEHIKGGYYGFLITYLQEPSLLENFVMSK